jgi:hypothetical protein
MGYGDNPTFLRGLEARQFAYVVGVSSSFGVRLPDAVHAATLAPPPRPRGRGQPKKPRPAPLYEAQAILEALPEDHWQTITWCEHDDVVLRKQCTAVRVCRATGGHELSIHGLGLGAAPGRPTACLDVERIEDQHARARVCEGLIQAQPVRPRGLTANGDLGWRRLARRCGDGCLHLRLPLTGISALQSLRQTCHAVGIHHSGIMSPFAHINTDKERGLPCLVPLQ